MLVVEDSHLNRDVAVALLADAGLIVETAENGSIAVDKVTGSSLQYYDAVFMDVQMPIMDGYEATRRIRQWEGAEELSNHIPIIALTAHALAGEEEKCLSAGMDGYLSKPLDEGELQQMLVRWLPDQQGEKERGNPSLSKSSHYGGVEILDTKSAIKRLGGRRQLYAKIVEKFQPEHEKAYKDITQQLASGDRKSASRIAHTIKGAAAAIGADQLSHISSELEKAIVDRVESIDGLLTSFKEKLSDAFTAIEAFLVNEQTRSMDDQKRPT